MIETKKNHYSHFFRTVEDRYLRWAELLVIVIFCSIPLFVKFPFRINLFLAWEGAYRLSEGQVPFRDFGLPLGFGFWIIPALFFKLLGAQMITLVKAQVFVNVITMLAFRSILKTLGTPAAARLIALLVLALSYVLVNFWPWYNNMVFVYELLAIQTLLLGCYRYHGLKAHVLVALSALFVVLSVFTKQDGGGLALLVVTALLALYLLRHRRWSFLATYAASGILGGLLFVLPFLPYGIDYWFNYGQEPHYSRINAYDFLQDIFGRSFEIKAYLAAITLVLIYRYRTGRQFWDDERTVMFALLTVAILGQALLIQVTSYIPHNVNVYFHGFAIAFLLYAAAHAVQWQKLSLLLLSVGLVFFCFSGDYWVYANRVFRKFLPAPRTEGVISKNSWSSGEDSLASVSRANWVESDYWVFEDVYLPEKTIAGIKNIEALPVVKEKGRDLRVLNMTELTPLVQILDYQLETGTDYPLWFHHGVSMFDREVAMFCRAIENQAYDLVLFETIPNLNNFYPEQVRDCIRQHYRQTDRFLAPRVKHNAHVEVYVRSSSE